MSFSLLISRPDGFLPSSERVKLLLRAVRLVPVPQVIFQPVLQVGQHLFLMPPDRVGIRTVNRDVGHFNASSTSTSSIAACILVRFMLTGSFTDPRRICGPFR